MSAVTSQEHHPNQPELMMRMGAGDTGGVVDAGGPGDPMYVPAALDQRAEMMQREQLEQQMYEQQQQHPPLQDAYGGGGSLGMGSQAGDSVSFPSSDSFVSGVSNIFTPQQLLPPHWSGMQSSTTRILGTTRTTQSDVMCVSNSSREHEMGRTARPRHSPSHAAKLPYQDLSTLVLGGNAKQQTLLERKHDRAARRRKSRVLHDEYREFITRLKLERSQRMALENWSAVRIQSAWRGFRVRPRMYMPRRKSAQQGTEDLRRELIKWARQLELEPIPGFTLGKATRKSKRRRQLEAVARLKLQCFARVVLAKRSKWRKIMVVNVLTMNESARGIQRAWRKYKERQHQQRLEQLMTNSAAVRVQSRYRAFAARFRVRVMKRQQQERSRTEDAAVTIQCALRRQKAVTRSRSLRSLSESNLDETGADGSGGGSDGEGKAGGASNGASETGATDGKADDKPHARLQRAESKQQRGDGTGSGSEPSPDKSRDSSRSPGRSRSPRPGRTSAAPSPQRRTSGMRTAKKSSKSPGRRSIRNSRKL